VNLEGFKVSIETPFKNTHAPKRLMIVALVIKSQFVRIWAFLLVKLYAVCDLFFGLQLTMSVELETPSKICRSTTEIYDAVTPP